MKADALDQFAWRNTKSDRVGEAESNGEGARGKAAITRQKKDEHKSERSQIVSANAILRQVVFQR